jgi:iron complex transport system permease protein
VTRTRTGAVLLLLALALAAIMIAGVGMGAAALEPRAVLDGILGRGDAGTVAIVRELRLPRVLLAALCGASLALSGAASQALFRNVLAEPYLLGISSGAAVGAVLAVVLRLDGAGPWTLPIAAFLGSAAALALVLRVAVTGSRVLDRTVLLLAGVVVGAFANAVVLLFLAYADTETFRSAVFWMMGSLAGATWERVGVMTVVLIAGGGMLAWLARPLDLLAVGEPTAAALGVPVERAKRTGLLAAALLAAGAVAVAGVIGFVGLVVPHALRLLVGSLHRRLLPAAALGGAAFLVLADVTARAAARPAELPIGVVTALVGVPVFVLLLRRRHG